MASSLYDIGMIDEAEGDLETARAHYQEGLQQIRLGDFPERIPIFVAAVARLEG